MRNNFYVFFSFGKASCEMNSNYIVLILELNALPHASVVIGEICVGTD